jgi:hypothetical protein
MPVLESVPSYSSSSPAPPYSTEPLEDEECLDYSHRFHRRSTPQSKFIKKNGRITITLDKQDDKAKVPTYGKGDLIAGAISLEDCENVAKVTIEVQNSPFCPNNPA